MPRDSTRWVDAPALLAFLRLTQRLPGLCGRRKERLVNKVAVISASSAVTARTPPVTSVACPSGDGLCR
jgi:hypothetical protein